MATKITPVANSLEEEEEEEEEGILDDDDNANHQGELPLMPDDAVEEGVVSGSGRQQRNKTLVKRYGYDEYSATNASNTKRKKTSHKGKMKKSMANNNSPKHKRKQDVVVDAATDDDESEEEEMEKAKPKKTLVGKTQIVLGGGERLMDIPKVHENIEALTLAQTLMVHRLLFPESTASKKSKANNTKEIGQFNGYLKKKTSIYMNQEEWKELEEYNYAMDMKFQEAVIKMDIDNLKMLCDVFEIPQRELFKREMDDFELFLLEFLSEPKETPTPTPPPDNCASGDGTKQTTCKNHDNDNDSDEDALGNKVVDHIGLAFARARGQNRIEPSGGQYPV